MSENKESQSVEFKRSWRDEYLKWICGYANADGGVLYIGKDDDGKNVGLSNAAKLLEDIPNKVRNLLGILVEVNLQEAKGRHSLEIAVPSYPAPVSFRGRYYQRIGSTNQELTGTALDRFLLRKQGRTWDSVPVPGVGVEDLSVSAFKRFRKLASAGSRIDPEDLQASDAVLIDKLKLTEGDYLKRAAVLLFHEDPERFAAGAFVKVGFFRTEADLVYHDMVQGDIFTQVAETVDLIQKKYLKAAISYQGLQRIEQYPVPDPALREAVLNAVVHRDYAVSAPIQIKVYNDHLKIWNPAVLPEGWTLDNLLGEHASHPYNPDIANAFFRAGEIEAWGRGIQRIFEACRKAETPQPVIRYQPNDLWFEFPYSEAYLEAVDSKETAPGPSTPPVGTKSALSRHQVKILNKCRNDSKLVDLLAITGRSDRTKFRNQVLNPLLDEGLVEMTIPDKPTSSKQKYRLTDKGRAFLASLEKGNNR